MAVFVSLLQRVKVRQQYILGTYSLFIHINLYSEKEHLCRLMMQTCSAPTAKKMAFFILHLDEKNLKLHPTIQIKFYLFLSYLRIFEKYF